MITTRFVIGDEVYFLSQNKIKKAKIQRMTVEIDAGSLPKTKCFFRDSLSGKEFARYEKDVYTTPDELVTDLMMHV